LISLKTEASIHVMRSAVIAHQVTSLSYLTQLSNILASEVHGSQSGRHVTAKLLELVTNHFSLSSTTVTGIPMKVNAHLFKGALL
jgi:hypothetical protein